MLKYTVRRFFEMILTLFIIATATFFLLEAVPGDPLTTRAERLPEAVAENLYRTYGLDKPTMERYFITMKGMLQGNFGESIRMPGYTIQDLLRDTLEVGSEVQVRPMDLLKSYTVCAPAMRIRSLNVTGSQS